MYKENAESQLPLSFPHNDIQQYQDISDSEDFVG